MRTLVQRVAWAQVETGGDVVGRVGLGLLVYLGVAADDTLAQARWLANKVAGVRIFEDAQGSSNLSVKDIQGGILVVTNPTLLADGSKGCRPKHSAAAKRDHAEALADTFVSSLRSVGLRVETGVSDASMFVRSEAHGPVNVIIDTPVEPEQANRHSLSGCAAE